jgi:glycosyltransferase involved in cell wall biosynthesis
VNVLFTVPTFRKWGGVNEVMVLLAEHLHKMGHRVVIASEDATETVYERLGTTCVHYEVPLRARDPSRALLNLLRLLRIARREQIDVISSHQYKTTILCRAVEGILGIPVVHSAHVWLGRRRTRWLPGLGKHVVANCEAIRDYVVRMFGVPGEHITVILDAARILPSPQAADVERVRAEFGLTPGQPVLICLGRLIPEKGQAVLLQAMRAVHGQFPNVRLLIVGKGHSRRALEALAGSLGLNGTVTFTGYRPDLSAIICAATVAVLPSLAEAFPTTIIECLRLGVPVVTTALPGIGEMFCQNEAALLVPPGDPDALADAVVRLIRTPALGTMMVERALATVVSRFDPSVMCQAYEEYFASVVGKIGVKPQNDGNRSVLGR